MSKCSKEMYSFKGFIHKMESYCPAVSAVSQPHVTLKNFLKNMVWLRSKSRVFWTPWYCMCKNMVWLRSQIPCFLDTMILYVYVSKTQKKCVFGSMPLVFIEQVTFHLSTLLFLTAQSHIISNSSHNSQTLNACINLYQMIHWMHMQNV